MHTFSILTIAIIIGIIIPFRGGAGWWFAFNIYHAWSNRYQSKV